MQQLENIILVSLVVLSPIFYEFTMANFWSIIEVQRKPCSEVGYLSPTEHPVGFESATYPFDNNVLTQ